MCLNKTQYTKSYKHLSTTLLVKVISFFMLRIQMSTYIPLLLGKQAYRKLNRSETKTGERLKESCHEEDIRHKGGEMIGQ